MNKVLSKFKSEKKGLLALETLVGLIISVLALFFVISFLADFLETPENKKIAENDINSINDFIKSSDRDFNKQNCFTSLKISHLENFQFEESLEKNYFYIIDSEYIYILRLNDLEITLKDFENQKFDFEKKIIKKINFNTNIKLVNDITDEGSFIENIFNEANYGAMVSDKLNFAKISSELELEKNVKFLILKPVLLESNQNNWVPDLVSKYYKKIFNSDYSINYLKPIIVSENGRINEDSNGKKIYYNPFYRHFFISKSEYSNMIADQYLCSTNQLYGQIPIDFFTKKDSNGNYVNLDKIDYINRRIIINIQNQNPLCNEIFMWENKPVCKKNQLEINCESIFNNFNHNIDFDSFLKLVENYYKNNKNCDSYSYNLKFEDFTIDEIKNNNYNLKFDQVFDIYLDENKNPINIYQLSSEEKEDFVIDFSDWGGLIKRDFNNKDMIYSNYAGYSNSKIYFYVSGNINDAKYYSFKEHYLRKKVAEDTKIYLNGIELKQKGKIEGKLPGIIFFRDVKFILWLSVNIEGKEYDILLSPYQYYNIPILTN